ncbi:MAG: lysophospholipid acyltransferase family protein [Acidobacteria bacterium]|nr:lysophospholipid acyltransferase family protein [Acidobacteriota bacterium]
MGRYPKQRRIQLKITETNGIMPQSALFKRRAKQYRGEPEKRFTRLTHIEAGCAFTNDTIAPGYVTLESYFVYILAKTAIFFMRALPRSLGLFLTRSMALAAYWLDPRHRHIADVNLKIAFPGLPQSRRSEIARRSFQNTALNLLEISRLPLLNRRNISKLVQYDSDSGLRNFHEAQSREKGILYLTGHFSAWELLPAAHAVYGHPLRFITRPLDNTRLDRYLQRLRECAGNRVIRKKNAARTVLRALKEKGHVGILMDQNTSLEEGIYADFFGLPAATTTALALLALRTDAPILPGYLTPMRGGRYRIKFLRPIEAARTGDRNGDVEQLTARLNRILEQIIREQPETWLWGHKRWKNQPAGNSRDLYRLSGEELDRFLESAGRASTPRADPASEDE